MNQLASPAQLRLSLLRWALFTMPIILVLGSLSGALSGSGEENRWYGELVKPDMQPPGWVFAVVWPTLYLMIGFAFSIILHARGAHYRGLAIGFFIAQLLLNFAWSPLFFGRHQVTLAFYLIIVILILAVVATIFFDRVRKLAAWLMLPYLAWLSFAAVLNFQVDRLNPDAESLYVPAASAQIGGG